jgi:hypothetical protein
VKLKTIATMLGYDREKYGEPPNTELVEGSFF